MPIVQQARDAAAQLADALAKFKALASEADRTRSAASDIARRLDLAWTPGRSGGFSEGRTIMRGILRAAFQAAGFTTTDLETLVR
jgi:hypothetical protein